MIQKYGGCILIRAGDALIVGFHTESFLEIEKQDEHLPHLAEMAIAVLRFLSI